jgi:hypothetical protein
MEANQKPPHPVIPACAGMTGWGDCCTSAQIAGFGRLGSYPHFLWISLWMKQGNRGELPVNGGLALRCELIKQNHNLLFRMYLFIFIPVINR